MTRSELEWQVLLDQLTRRKEEFIKRLDRNLISIKGPMPTLCRVWTGAKHGGKYGNTYAAMSFRVRGEHRGKSHIKIDVHRIFLMLNLKRPIADDMQAGHLCHNSLCVVHVEEITQDKNLRDRDLRHKSR